MKKIIISLVFLLTGLPIFNSCQKEVSTSVEEKLLTKNGVFVDSKPAGAWIYINGRNSGQRTPDTVYWVNSGLIYVTLKLDLFKDSTLAIIVKEGEVSSLFFDYTTNYSMLGDLYINSNPVGASIYLNDSSTNKITPYKFENILPGYYKIRLVRSGYWDENKITTVKSVVTTYVDYQITNSIIWVNMNTNRTKIPTDYLTSIAIEQGYIKWIGTLDKGLVKFNDREWTSYDISNSIMPDNKVNFVYIDNTGVKWICTDYGLVKIDGEQWSLFNSGNSGLTENRISTVYNDGIRIWIGTYNRGIIIYDGAAWIEYNTQNWFLPSNRITSITQNWNRTLIGTNRGILKISNDSIYQVLTSSNTAYPVIGGTCGFPNNFVNIIVQDIYGKAWVGCGMGEEGPGGLGIERLRYFSCYAGKPSDEVYAIAVDNNNVKWIGSSENGLGKWTNDGYNTYWTQYSKSNSRIGSDRILSVAIDGNGDKWLASYGGGLIKYKGN